MRLTASVLHPVADQENDVTQMGYDGVVSLSMNDMTARLPHAKSNSAKALPCLDSPYRLKILSKRRMLNGSHTTHTPIPAVAVP